MSLHTCETCMDDACAYQNTPSPQCDDFTSARPEGPRMHDQDEYDVLIAERDGWKRIAHTYKAQLDAALRRLNDVQRALRGEDG